MLLNPSEIALPSLWSTSGTKLGNQLLPDPFGPTLLGAGHFISTRAVQARNFRVEQAHVDSQLPPVMDDMVHHHAAKNRNPGHFDHLLTRPSHAPDVCHVGVGRF